MQNARVIQLGSSGVKVTRNSASFDEAFGGYSNKRKKKFSNAEGYNPSAEMNNMFNSPIPLPSTSNQNTANLPIVTDAERDYLLVPLFGSTQTTLNLVSGGGGKNFPNNVPLKMVRSYKILDNKPIEVKLTTTSNGAIYKVDPILAKDVLTNLQATLLQPNPIGASTTGTTTTNDPSSALTQMLTTLAPEQISRYTTDKPLAPLFQGFYKVVNDVFGQRDGAFPSKKFLKDEIVEGYLQTFDNPTTGGKNGYFVAFAEVPTTIGNASTTTQVQNVNAPVSSVAPSLATSGTATGTATTGGTATSVGTPSGTTTTTQTSANPNVTNSAKQLKSSATGMVMAKFKLPLYALVPAVNTSGGTNQGGGNYDPNQGGGAYTGGGSSSDALDQLNAQIESQYGSQTNQDGGGYMGSADALAQMNAQIEAQQLAQQQQEGGQMGTEQQYQPSAYEQSIYTYTPTQDELMVDVDTNYAPDTDVESSFDGFTKSNAMETKINDLATKIAWNKEMAEMLKMKKGVDKTALKEEYMNKVDRVNELLKELKACETPANREYILKMIAKCDMMRPSMKNKMKKDIVIQNANPKIIDLGNATPSEFKNDLGNTIMEDEDSSFMGDVIEYSAFSGSSTTTALMGVGIGAVLGIIGIVVIKKMGK